MAQLQLQLKRKRGVILFRQRTSSRPPANRGPALPPSRGIGCGAGEGTGGETTLDRMLDGWLVSSAARHKRSTHAVYETVVNRHIRPHLGNCPLTDLTPERVSVFLREKAAGSEAERPLAPSTLCGIITVLRSVLQYAESQGHSVCAWAGLTRPRAVVRPVCVLTGTEQERLTSFLLRSGTAERLGVLLCLYTGLRLGEICALKWGDISADNQLLTVRRTVQRIRNPSRGADGHKTSMIFDTPKSQSALRSIPLPSFLLPYLERQRREADCFVLTGTEKLLEPRTLQSRFKAILLQAGVRDVNFHCLRHTFATHCVELGFDPKTLSVILGHADVSVTLNTYVHPSTSRIRSCMELLGPDRASGSSRETGGRGAASQIL